VAADFACKTIDPNNPTGPKVDVIFPGGYTLRLFKFSPVEFENLRAAKHVLESFFEESATFAHICAAIVVMPQDVLVVYLLAGKLH